MATTSFGIRPSRYIRQAATDTLQDKTNYVSIMQNLMLGLQGGTWTAARSPLGDVGMPQHDFAKGPYLGGQYDAYKMCGLYNETTMKYFGYAGCVAYRFKVPDSYRGHYDAETCYLKEIVIPATRDRFLKSGYRIHAVASDAELPSSDWGVIHAESDASGSDVTVYRMAPLASQEGVTYLVDAMPLSTRHQVDVTQKAEAISQKNYVYVYLTLNDYTDRWTKYNTKEARLYAIEGAAAMNPDDFVFSWEDANGIVVPDDAPPPMEFNVCRGGVLPPLVGEVSGIQTLDVSFDGVNITDSTDRMLKPGMKNVEDVDSANGLRTLYGLFYNGEAKQLQTSEFSELKSMARPGASFAVSIRNEDGDIQPFSNIKRTKFKEGGFFDGVAFGDGVFVACDFNSGAWYSTDKGRTWTHGNVNKDFFYVAFGNGVFVAGTDSGSSGEGIWRSTDGGKTWTQSSIADGDWGGIVYSNGVFIIGGANTTGQGIWRSTDGGITWTQSNQTTGRWRSFAEGNGVVVAGEIGGKISSSNDLGITWTQCDVITSNWTSIAYGNGVFIACCSTSDERIWRSTDGGVTWNVSACRSVQPVGISYGNGIFSIADYNNGVFYSIDDGETFKQVRYIEYGEVVSAVCYGDGEFIYLGRGFAYYNDFKNEVEPLFEVIETSERYDVIVFGEGVFIASGEYTKAKRSTDNGRTWSEIQPNIKLKSLAYGSGVFLGRAESYLIRSVDKGLTWTNISNEFNFTEISFGNGLFVASAGNGLFYSTDGGVTWTQSNITSAVNVKMAFGNGVFVALNMYNGDKNFYSTDGRTLKNSKFNL